MSCESKTAIEYNCFELLNKIFASKNGPVILHGIRLYTISMNYIGAGILKIYVYVVYLYFKFGGELLLLNKKQSKLEVKL